MPCRRYTNSSKSTRSTPYASQRGNRPTFCKQAGHWSGGPSWGMAVAVSLSQGRHVSLDCSHSGQSQRTWTSSSCAAPQRGDAELVRVPWTDTLAGVHKALTMRPCSSDFSNSVEAARSAARQVGPSASLPSPRRWPGAAPQAGSRKGSVGYPTPGAGPNEGYSARSAAGALVPGSPSTSNPRVGSTPGWPSCGARAPAGPSRAGGHVSPRWPG